jgi:transposase InsO family protein
MKLHRNARTCPNSRALMARRVLEQKWSLRSAAAAAGVSVRCARKWVRRAAVGEALEDRSSRPRRSPNATPKRLVRAIDSLRRLHMTDAEIAELLGMALSTVSLILKRIGLGKRSRLEPPEPPNRYERRHPGELLHIDVKKLGRIDGAGKRWLRRGPGLHRKRRGWEFVHVCVDDATRLAYVEVLRSETAADVVAFLRRAVAYFGIQGIRVERVMTDNGPGYRSALHAAACSELGIRHLRTRPYRPRTNGKAERFIQTLMRDWAYIRIYASSRERTAALGPWLERYNFRRPHGSLAKKTPAVRFSELTGTNLVGIYS